MAVDTSKIDPFKKQHKVFQQQTLLLCTALSMMMDDKYVGLFVCFVSSVSIYLLIVLFVYGLFVLFCFVLFCFVLFCFVLFCFVLFCFVLFCFVLFCFVLFCFVLFCFVLFVYIYIFRYELAVDYLLWAMKKDEELENPAVRRTGEILTFARIFFLVNYPLSLFLYSSCYSSSSFPLPSPLFLPLTMKYRGS